MLKLLLLLLLQYWFLIVFIFIQLFSAEGYESPGPEGEEMEVDDTLTEETTVTVQAAPVQEDTVAGSPESDKEKSPEPEASVETNPGEPSGGYHQESDQLNLNPVIVLQKVPDKPVVKLLTNEEFKKR